MAEAVGEVGELLGKRPSSEGEFGLWGEVALLGRVVDDIEKMPFAGWHAAPHF